MATLLLIRHAVVATTGKRLYGTSPGVHLSDRGREQAARLAERLRAIRLAAVYSSPLERCLETAEPLVAGRALEVTVLPELGEVDMGSWTGRTFASLSRLPAWRLSRTQPSAFRFPEGEALLEVQARVIDSVGKIARRHRRDTAAVVTHGDPIRLALAHFAGIHFDLFQRLEVAPASVSALALGDGPPRILRINDTADLDDLGPPRRGR